MVRAFFAALLVAPLVLAGCIDAPAAVTGPDLAALAGLLPAETPLWNNPQTTPHPAFGFPTLTHPATGADVPALWKPIAPRALPSEIQGLELVAEGNEAGVEQGGGMTVFGSLAIVPGYGGTTTLVDISDPTAPSVLGSIDDAGMSHRGADVIAYPTGRLVAVFSTDAGFLDVYDITDPAEPVQLPKIEPKTGSHKVNVVPGTPIVYNANSNGGGPGWGTRTPEAGKGVTEIYDLSDPEKPVLVQEFPNGFGCHHIYFWIDPAQEKYRAICAGIEYTQIWDIADPLAPSVVVSVPVHHGNPKLPSATVPLAMFSHFAILNYAGDVLVVGDETGGGVVPPGCDVGVQAASRRASGPFGNLWFYDVSDEKNPVLKGWFSPTFPVAENPPGPGGAFGPLTAAFYSCTAHHGRLVPDPQGRDLLAMAFYRAGVYLVDFSDPSNPIEVSHWNAKGAITWEAQYYNGYVFTGDLGRGMDVLGFV